MDSSTATDSLAAARQAGEGVVRSSAFEVLGRAGFVARGLVYGIIGVLALQLALGAGGKITNQQGAFQTIARQPFGKLLLILLAIGLAGYSFWRLTRAIIGHGREDSDSALDRVSGAASGVAYAVLCVGAIEILVGSSGGGSSNAKHTTAGVLGWPGGAWLVGIAGLLMIGVALYQGYQGVSRDFLEDSRTEEMGAATKRWITGIGMVGHLARMVVFGLIGIFLVKAAIDFNSSAAVGLDGVLAKLLHHPYGSYLLGIVSAGLVTFAVYSFSDARYRRI